MSNVWGIWVAIYAAIVATGALFLEIRRWVESGPRLHLTTSPNMQILPSIDEKSYVMVFVSNRGSVATTITNLGLRRYDNWWEKFRKKPSEDLIITHPTIPGTDVGKLRHVLKPGSIWMSAMDQDHKMTERLNSGRFYVAVYVSHRNSPIVKRLPKLSQVSQTTGGNTSAHPTRQFKNSGDKR